MHTEDSTPLKHPFPTGSGSTEQVMLVSPAGKSKGEVRTVALQWYDGAGELHYETLSAELSQAYLVEE
jgi:hypothetical protein